LIDREILATRLSKLRDALRKLHQIRERSREDYLSSDIDRALSEHYLRIALEATLDAGNHLIAGEGFRKPLTLRDIPLILVENKVLPSELGRRLARAVGLRNRLVHGYGEVDHNLLYDVLKGDLQDLEDFAIALGSRYAEPDG